MAGSANPRSQNTPLAAFPEDSPSDDEGSKILSHRPQRTNVNNSDTPNPLLNTALSPVRNIRRRLLSRLRASPIRIFPPPSTLDPEASNLSPSSPGSSGKMPTKRKASSSARSGKSGPVNPRINSATQEPLIDAEDLIGPEGIVKVKDNTFEVSPGQPAKPRSSFTEIGQGFYGHEVDAVEDDDEEAAGLTNFLDDVPNLTSLPLAAAANVHHQQYMHQQQEQPIQRMRDSPAIVRNRASIPAPPKDKSSMVIHSGSVILFSYDGNSSASANGTAHLRYLPLCPATTSTWNGFINKSTTLTVAPHVRKQIDKAAAATFAEAKSTSWTPFKIPVEIFEIIIEFLSRTDIKSMRLVSKEFEKNVSRTLFNTSVVPFNTELYDMIDEDAKTVGRSSPQMKRDKGKGKAREWELTDPSAAGRSPLKWKNAKDDAEGKVYKGHGLRVFQGFGPHIRRFGMSFEVTEAQLSQPLLKKELDHLDSYFGSYHWPPCQYTRFANLAGLERTADDTLRMKTAFANLEIVRDLGLSIDSGLGWLNGPDKSLHARIVDRPSEVFGSSRDVPGGRKGDDGGFWDSLLAGKHLMTTPHNPKEVTLVRKELTKLPTELRGLKDTHYADVKFWPSLPVDKAIDAASVDLSVSSSNSYGIMYLVNNPPSANILPDKGALVPADLRKEQKEWLLETEWAQRAFLECYMLAVIDNLQIFGQVQTLNIAKLSSGLLPLIARESFWDALPGLSDVTIHVKPDWRIVERDMAGFAETQNQNPSEGVRMFHSFILRDSVCLRPSITKLNIGWASGGEHAEGIFARNTNILPAPVTLLEHTLAASPTFPLVLEHVEHLTLTNCWITPPALEEFIAAHANRSLKKLTLDSVSLSAHPRFPAGGAQAAQQAAQALLALNPQVAQQPPQQNVAAPNGVQPPGNNGALNGQAPNIAQWLNLPPQQAHGQQNMWLHLAQAGGAGANTWPLIPGAALAQNNLNGWPPLPGPLGGAQNNHHPLSHTQNQHWTDGHREGSWPEVLDKISPGPIFNDYRPQPPPWEEQFSEREETNLQTIELKSCGYVKLINGTPFDQLPVEALHEHQLSNWFRSRAAALASSMMLIPDRYLGRIIQHIPVRELIAMLLAWGLTEGWADQAKAEETEYDGLLPGGTGRFTGVISKGMPLRNVGEDGK